MEERSGRRGDGGVAAPSSELGALADGADDDGPPPVAPAATVAEPPIAAARVDGAADAADAARRRRVAAVTGDAVVAAVGVGAPPALAAALGDASGAVRPILPRDKPADLPTIIPPTVDPSVNAPPVFAESWGGDAPANPFSDVSDGAIEYFVEWSLEQSIGPRALPQARFSDVPMALPGQSGRWTAFDPATRRQRLMQLGAVFAAGALVGGAGRRAGQALAARRRRRRRWSRPSSRRAAAAAPPPEPPSAPSAAGRARRPTAELAITSRPSGASVSIDGAPRRRRR